MTDETSDWRARGCTIAGRQFGEWCGEPIHGAVLVRTYAVPLNPGPEEVPQVGVVLACRHHYVGLTAPPFPPDRDPAPVSPVPPAAAPEETP